MTGCLNHVVLYSIVSRSRSAHTSSISLHLRPPVMPRFFTGDELGSVKSVRYAQDGGSKEWKSDVTVVSSMAGLEAKPAPVQKLAFSATGAGGLVSCSGGDSSREC